MAIIFYEVSGGPFGSEESVSTGGPFLAILGFIILPLVWAVPEALITAELGTTFPENSGYVAWVTAAFGPFWGFLEGFLSWVSGVTDNAVYPVLFLSYLQAALPVLGSGWPRIVFLTCFSVALSYFNFRGLHVVGKAAVGITVRPELVPFSVMYVHAHFVCVCSAVGGACAIYTYRCRPIGLHPRTVYCDDAHCTAQGRPCQLVCAGVHKQTATQPMNSYPMRSTGLECCAVVGISQYSAVERVILYVCIDPAHAVYPCCIGRCGTFILQPPLHPQLMNASQGTL